MLMDEEVPRQSVLLPEVVQHMCTAFSRIAHSDEPRLRQFPVVLVMYSVLVSTATSRVAELLNDGVSKQVAVHCLQKDPDLQQAEVRNGREEMQSVKTLNVHVATMPAIVVREPLLQVRRATVILPQPLGQDLDSAD